jgi:hypothetical protein
MAEVKGKESTEYNFVEDLIAAKKKFKPIEKDKVNPHFKNSYSSHNAINRAVEPALHEHGFVLTHHPSGDCVTPTYTTTLQHRSGQILEAVSNLYYTASMQSEGSAQSYAMRYNIRSVLNLASDESDDDGNSAANGEGRTVGRKAPPRAPNPPRPPAKMPVQAPKKSPEEDEVDVMLSRILSFTTEDQLRTAIKRAAESPKVTGSKEVMEGIFDGFSDRIKAVHGEGSLSDDEAMKLRQLLLSKHMAVEMERESQKLKEQDGEDPTGTDRPGQPDAGESSNV